MTSQTTLEPLAAQLSSAARSAGLQLADGGGTRLEGEAESILAKWFLGKRSVRYHMSCDLDEAARTATFREFLVERTNGMPPPGLSVEKTSQRGSKVQIDRKDVAVGGGGRVSFGALRGEFERIVTAAGWRFNFQPLRAP